MNRKIGWNRQFRKRGYTKTYGVRNDGTPVLDVIQDEQIRKLVEAGVLEIAESSPEVKDEIRRSMDGG